MFEEKKQDCQENMSIEEYLYKRRKLKAESEKILPEYDACGEESTGFPHCMLVL